jgi:parallel beta-helix repeat protein
MPHRHVRPSPKVHVGHVQMTSLPVASRAKAVLIAALLATLLSVLVAFGRADNVDAATACDKYVSSGGSVQLLLDSLSSGQVGCLRSGTYSDPDGSLTIKKSGVTLTSAPDSRAVLNARIYVPEGVNLVTVSYLKINGTPDKANVLIRGDYTKWLNNEVTNAHRHDSCFLVGSNYNGQATASGTVIRNNSIHDCGKLPRTNLDHGIYVSDARDTAILDNHIYYNADRGVQLYPDAQGTLLEGNTINANGQGMVFDGSSSNNIVRANIISNSATYNVYAPNSGGRGNLVEHNCLWKPNGTSGVKPNSLVFTARNNVVANPDSPLCRSVL